MLSVGKLTFRDCVGLFLTCAMRYEADYHRTSRPLAQLAIGAGDVVALLGWANDTLAALGSIKGVRGPLWHNGDNGSSLQIGESVSVGEIVCRQVNCKPVCVCGFDGLTIAFVLLTWLMGISKPTAAFVCFDNLLKIGAVDIVADAWQITRLVMTPHLPARESANLLGQDIKGIPTLAACNFAPMHSEGSILSVAWTCFSFIDRIKL